MANYVENNAQTEEIVSYYRAVTAEGFVSGTVPKKGDAVGIGANGKIAAGSTGLGTCVDVEVVGRHTYYAIKIGKTEAAAAAKA